MSNETDKIIALARQGITATFLGSPLFQRVRSDGLYHYVLALEGKALHGILLSPSVEDAHLGLFDAHRTAVESSAKILPALFSYCRNESRPIVFSAEAYKEAEALVELAREWEAIDYSFALAAKGQWAFSVDQTHSRITFSYSSSREDEADTELRSRELETILSGERGRPSHAQLLALMERLGSELQKTVQTTGIEQCSYEYTDGLYRILPELADELIKAVPHEMDASAQVDDFTFADLRKFWGALLALSQVHFYAHSVAMHAAQVFPGRSIVFYKPRRELVHIISRITGLTPAVVDKLIGLHLYDYRLWSPHTYDGPILQPLLPLNDDEVCLPSTFISGNSFERNFFKLLHRHPDLRRFANNVESLKEPTAINALNALFPSEKYRTKSGIKIPGVTDIDFATYEIATGFALLIQHKWLTPPETGNESASNDERLDAGVSQARDAQKYVRDHPEFLHRALGLERAEKFERIESAVVCRGFEHTGFMNQGSIPVIMEVAFHAIVKASADFIELWNKLNTRPDRQESATKVVDVMKTVKIGDYEFVLPCLGRF